MTSTSLLHCLRDPRNKTAWSQFVGRYRPLIVSYARRYFNLEAEDAEDAAQAALIAFSEAYQQGAYDRKKGRLRHWLFGIARNHIRKTVNRVVARQKLGPTGQADETAVVEQIPDEDRLEEYWEAEWRRFVYRQCLEEIRVNVEPRRMHAFEQFAIQGRPAQDVANDLGMSPNAVYLAKHEILRRIRELLPQLEEMW